MIDIVQQSGTVNRQNVFGGEFAEHGKHGAGIQHGPHQQHNGQKSKGSQYPGLCPGAVVVEHQSGKEAAEPIGKHLPGGPGALAEKEIAGEGGNGAGEEACLRSKGDAGNHDDAGDGFQKGGEGKYHPGHRCQRCHYGENHQLPRLGLAGFKAEEKGEHQLNDDQGADEIVPPPLDLGAQVEGQGNQDENRQQGKQCGFFHTPAPFCFSREMTSPAVTALRKVLRLMRPAEVV